MKNIEQRILYFFDGNKKEYQNFLKRYSQIAKSRNCDLSELVKTINSDSSDIISEKEFRSFLLSVK